MLIGKVLAQRALITPSREALLFQGKSFTFRELNRRSNRMANAFLDLGVSPGDRVGLLMANCNEFLETYFAAAKIGAVLVPLNIRLTPADLDFMLKDVRATEFVYGHAFEEKVREMAYAKKARHRISTGPSSLDSIDYEDLLHQSSDKEPSVDVEENDLHIVMYTSGTTGYPKGAMLSHRGVYVGAVDILVGLHYHYPDRCLLLAPLFHSGAITPFVAQVIRGISTILMAAFEPAEALKLIERHKATHMLGVTAIMRMLMNVPGLEAYDLGFWRYAILPGSPLPYELIKEAQERIGVLCQNLWGLTEMCGPGSLMNVEDILRKPESAGKPYFNVDLRIVDLWGRDAAPGELGEILVRGPNMMLGYWKQPEETAKIIKNGWLYTGDMGRFDEEGYLYVVDRLKDMIVSGGENVYPAEIERAIREMDGIQDVSVIGIPDEKWGEVPKAFIETGKEPAPSPEEIMRFCRSKLAGYKVPRHFEYVEQLPRTPSGKVLKKDLRLWNKGDNATKNNH